MSGLVVWMDGAARPAGYLAAEGGGVAFIYDEAYAQAGGPPLSLSMPLAQGAFDDVLTRAFFDNLLPENDQMRRVMDREGLARDDIVGLLSHLGADCSGSISCLPIGAPPIKTPGVLAEDYEPFGAGELDEIVRSLAERGRLPDAAGDPSPVAGVQRKIALTNTEAGYLRPREDRKAPTTHILKVPALREGREARIEAAAAHLARALGLDVAIPRAVRFGDVEALLIPRFDRVVTGGVVYRIHQEDFAQALGLPASLKYQRNGAPGRRFDVEGVARVLDQTDAPARARQAFLSATVFNLLIGNTDNHAKNHGLLYQGRTPRLAPLYDLLPSRMNPDYNDHLSFEIGGADHPDALTADDLKRFIGDLGFSKTAATRLIETLIGPMVVALETATRGLAALGLKDFDDLIGRETEQLVETLSLNIPVRERDYFPSGRHALAAS